MGAQRDRQGFLPMCLPIPGSQWYPAGPQPAEGGKPNPLWATLFSYGSRSCHPGISLGWPQSYQGWSRSPGLTQYPFPEVDAYVFQIWNVALPVAWGEAVSLGDLTWSSRQSCHGELLFHTFLKKEGKIQVTD